eukprot:TRINITY_DN2318_c5_g1_i1.p1 TRINITY_DN2318_c5_g1~~TRINITY_DN2318_c5_g1_i1.p1  ORF type:complete len:195 (-),score=39.26 TRINITY_DN2318_c5_g1_i1:103-687(-)
MSEKVAQPHELIRLVHGFLRSWGFKDTLKVFDKEAASLLRKSDGILPISLEQIVNGYLSHETKRQSEQAFLKHTSPKKRKVLSQIIRLLSDVDEDELPQFTDSNNMYQTPSIDSTNPSMSMQLFPQHVEMIQTLFPVEKLAEVATASLGNRNQPEILTEKLISTAANEDPQAYKTLMNKLPTHGAPPLKKSRHI